MSCLEQSVPVRLTLLKLYCIETDAVVACAALFPGYSVHLVNGSAFLPNLPAPLQYHSVQGAIVAVLTSNASANATSQVPSRKASQAKSTSLGMSAVQYCKRFQSK